MFFKSLKNALKGIIYCINSERNFRVHTVVALYVLFFSRYFNLSSTQYAILFFTIALVMLTECFNTAIEKILDFTQENYNPVIKLAKDISAGAVLIAAIGAICVGVNLFWNIEVWLVIFEGLKHRLDLQMAFLISILLSVVYINGINSQLLNRFIKFITEKKERKAI